jgi:multifunctional methyltransferase subunit TRM112
MKLLTHNLLQCPLSGTYPLKIEATTVERNESEYRADVVLNMLPKLEWSVLLEAAAAVGFEGMPETPPPNPSEDDAFLRLLHSCILDVRHPPTGCVAHPTPYTPRPPRAPPAYACDCRTTAPPLSHPGARGGGLAGVVDGAALPDRRLHPQPAPAGMAECPHGGRPVWLGVALLPDTH